MPSKNHPVSYARRVCKTQNRGCRCLHDHVSKVQYRTWLASPRQVAVSCRKGAPIPPPRTRRMRHRAWGLGNHTEILCALLLLGFSLPAHPYAKAPICIMVDRATEPKTIVSMTATSVVSETCTSSRQVGNWRRKSWGGQHVLSLSLRFYYARLCK